MNNRKSKLIVYLLPYLILLMLGAWYRLHTSNIAFFHGDSGNYLIPPFLKQLTGEWHKGERPMQYLRFIYLTLTETYDLRYTIIVQKLLGLAGAGFLVAAWLTFVNTLRDYKLLWHLGGYFMLSIYISTPVLMYFEQLIGPESACMFVMCVLIYCLSVVFSKNMNTTTASLFLAITVFVNLYLANPMPKLTFASFFLEILLLYIIIKSSQLSVRQKFTVLIIPHFLYLVIVAIPEFRNKIDRPDEDRVYIEYQQMAYTHFDILARDKSNFEVSPELQDSLMKYFHDAKMQQAGALVLIGFNADHLMWGKASNAVNQYFDYNFDSIGNFYKRLNWTLLTKYPLALTLSIAKQITAFYIPNKYIHKDLYCHQDIPRVYEGSISGAQELDSNLKNKLNDRYYGKHEFPPLASKYPPTMEEAGVGNYYEKLPLLYGNYFWFYEWFDYVFIAALLAFLITRVYKGEIFRIHLVSILYFLITIYVITVGIVHSFDVVRFIITIYPFILITTFMALAYIAQEWLSFIRKLLKQKIS